MVITKEIKVVTKGNLSDNWRMKANSDTYLK